MKILLDEEIEMKAAKSKTLLQVDLEFHDLILNEISTVHKEVSDAGK